MTWPIFALIAAMIFWSGSWSMTLLIAACIFAAPFVLSIGLLLVFSIVDGIRRVLP